VLMCSCSHVGAYVGVWLAACYVCVIMSLEWDPTSFFSSSQGEAVDKCVRVVVLWS